MKIYTTLLCVIILLCTSILIFKFVNPHIGVSVFITGLTVLMYLSLKKTDNGTVPGHNLPKYLIPEKTDTEELVVAMCNEDVSWIDEHAHKYKLVTVYNKCGKVVKFKSPNVKVIESPNIGTCDHAYLSYIIERYDSLPTFIEFTKGWKPPKGEYHNCLPCKTDKEKHAENMSFKLTEWNFSNPVNSHKKGLSKFQTSKYNNMGEWVKDSEFLTEEIYKRNTCNMIYGGQFGTTKDQILKTPKKVWEHLRSQQKYPREEVDHFIERTWGPLLCKPAYNLVIVSTFKDDTDNLKEWFKYYVNQGVQYFYMINNGSRNDWKKEIEGFPVTVHSVYKNHKIYQYNYFLSEVKRNAEWVMFVNPGEYVYSINGLNIINSIKKDSDIQKIPLYSLERKGDIIRRSYSINNEWSPLLTNNYKYIIKVLHIESLIDFNTENSNIIDNLLVYNSVKVSVHNKSKSNNNNKNGKKGIHKHILISSLKNIINILKDSNIPWVVVYGTLLGLIRDDNPIDNDDDIDIMVPLEYKENIKQLLVNTSLIPTIVKENILQYKDSNGVLVDFYMGIKYNKNGYDICDKWENFPFKISPVKKFQWGEYIVNIPNNFERMLSDHYANWMIPTNSKGLASKIPVCFKNFKKYV